MSSPTSSMSGVRKHFCAVVVSGAGGASRPRKYGICGCIPAIVRSVERSSARGTSDAEGRRRWPFSSKKERKPSRISSDVRIGGHCRRASGTAEEIAAPRRRIVLVPPSRRTRKRYRYRLRRLTPVGARRRPRGRSAARGSGRTQSSEPIAAAGDAPQRAAAVAQRRSSGRRQRARRSGCSSAARSSATRSRRGSLGAAAVLVDAKTGRVLWAKQAHERRQVASTTKIMTALLALRKLRPHDIVTVDKSVPRVPLVREGLRAGEQVEAWKLFYSLLLLLGERRRARAGDRRRRRQVDVHPRDERRGAASSGCTTRTSRPRAA